MRTSVVNPAVATPPFVVPAKAGTHNPSQVLTRRKTQRPVRSTTRSCGYGSRLVLAVSDAVRRSARLAGTTPDFWMHPPSHAAEYFAACQGRAGRPQKIREEGLQETPSGERVDHQGQGLHCRD